MLDFTKMEKPEGMTDEMLNDAKVQAFVQGLIDNQKTAAVSQVQSQLDSAVTAKAIADQKVQDLQDKVSAAGKKTNTGDNAEHAAALKALQDQIADNNAAMAKQTAQIDRADVSQYITSEINAYNAANKGSKIASGAESYVLDAALATFKKNEAGQIVPFKGDTVLTGNSGFMSGVEFITNFRTEKPIFFEQPSGGGAAGSNGGGANGDNAKYFKKGDDFNLTKQAELRASNPSEYNRLKKLAA